MFARTHCDPADRASAFPVKAECVRVRRGSPLLDCWALRFYRTSHSLRFYRAPTSPHHPMQLPACSPCVGNDHGDQWLFDRMCISRICRGKPTGELMPKATVEPARAANYSIRPLRRTCRHAPEELSGSGASLAKYRTLRLLAIQRRPPQLVRGTNGLQMSTQRRQSDGYRNPSRLCSCRAVPVHVTIQVIPSQRGVSGRPVKLSTACWCRSTTFGSGSQRLTIP